MRRLVLALAATAILTATSISLVAAAPLPVTYLNANFGPPNDSGIAFYRSSGTIKLESPTASVSAKASGFEVDFSASAENDPYETSAGFSSYDVGTVNTGLTGGMNGLSVAPRTLLLSGSAHFAMNLWFDSNHDGEYFAWDHNQFAGLGGDVYAIGPSETGPVTITATTPLFLIPYCNLGDNFATLQIINSGGCSTIGRDTNVARWVGIDIAEGMSGSGSARL